MHAASHTVHVLSFPENQCSRTVLWATGMLSLSPSPLSLLPAFFFPQVLHSWALLGSFVAFGKPSTKPFLWKLFIGLFFLPFTQGE